MNPVLSIIIPTYKRQDSLERLLKALVAQKGVDAEIIVVDQNPPGYLDGVILPGVQRLVLSSPNASDARNQGFLRSKGEYVLFVDDDLIPTEDFCAEALAIFALHPSIGGFSPLVYNAEGQQLALQQIGSKKITSLKEDPRIFSITDTISATLFFRRSYYIQTGGFDPLLFDFAKTAEDQEFFLRMLMKGLPFHYVPLVEIYHDEGVAGGCELRTEDYWRTREKCMKSWAYRRRIHHSPPGVLSLGDVFQLARSGFLNKEVLLSGAKEISRQVRLLFSSVKASKDYLRSRQDYYLPAAKMDHLSHS